MMKKIWQLIKWQFFMDDESLAKAGTAEDPLQQAFNILPYILLIAFLSTIYHRWESIKIYFLSM